MSRDDRALAQEVEDLRRRVDALARAGQLANASIEDGALTAFDSSGNVRTIIGVQPDGTVTVQDFNGPPPPTPTAPSVTSLVGQAAVTWNGLFEEVMTEDRILINAPTPSDFKHIEVHASRDDGFTLSDATQVGTIVSRLGGTVSIALEAGVVWYIALQAVTTSGAESGKSPEVSVVPMEVEDPVRFYQDEIVVPFGGYKNHRIDLTYLPVDNSEHVYWNGLYQEGSRWSREWDSSRLIVHDDDGRVANGDRLTVEYAHREVSGAPEWDPMEFLRCTGVSQNAAAPSALPPGTEVGDTLIVATSGAEFGNVTVGADQFHTKLTIFGGGMNLHLGVVKRLAPIAIQLGNQSGARSNHALCWTTRAKLDGRISSASVSNLDTTTFFVPSPGGRGSGFIGILINWGGIGGGYSGWDFRNTPEEGGGPWNYSCSDGTYHNIASAWTPQTTLGTGLNVTARNTGVAAAWCLGVTM